jgi:DNA-binding NarL/FixJ family response regulator
VNGDDPISVVVVDDHEVVRRGLRAYFDELDDVTLVAEAASGDAALEELAALSQRGELPSTVLMDLVMAGRDGVSTIAELKRLYPEVKVVVVTSFGETQRIHSALEAGAVGYVLKDADVDEIVVALRAAQRGEVHLGSAVASKLSQSLVSPPEGVPALTLRERDILTMIAQGHSNRRVAAELMISERTVAMHLTSIFAKLQVTSRTQAALWAVREGLVTLTS